MQSRSLIPAVAAALVVAGAIACSGSDSTAPGSPSAAASFESQASAELAPSAGEDVGSTYSFFSGADVTGSGGAFSVNAPGATLTASGASASINAPPPGAAAAWISPSCTFDAGTGRFACPPVTKGGMTFTASYALFDANNVTQSSFDKVTTASINFIVTDSGAVSYSSNGNTFSDTTLRRHNRTVSGLAGDPDTVHVWNGTGTGSVRSSRSGQITKTYVFASTDTVSNVAFRQPRDINPYPLRGTIVKSYTVTRTREASDTTTHTTTRRVVVTFNGTANVPMTVGTESYMLNLDTHKVTKQ
ncbi:MAG TPA: hypothetical protein VGT98_13880 [Candidatus Elarobacter sp.]|nr:hypothetical protein [Candidatus Elarobacter sp.]